MLVLTSENNGMLAVERAKVPPHTDQHLRLERP